MMHGMATTNSSVGRAINEATMPYALARAAVPYLKATPEYEQARKEKRSRKWLDDESLSVGYALAEVLRDRLGALEP